MELKVGILVSPCPSLRPSPHYSPCYSPHYGLMDAENWECGNILRVISALWLKCGYNAEISPYSCPNTPIRIFSAFPPHFFPYQNAEISPRCCPNTPIRIFSAFAPHFFPHFFPYKNAEISPRSCPNTPIRIFSAMKIRRSGVRASDPSTVKGGFIRPLRTTPRCHLGRISWDLGRCILIAQSELWMVSSWKGVGRLTIFRTLVMADRWNLMVLTCLFWLHKCTKYSANVT